MRKHASRRARGFSLLEVMVSTAILAVGVLGVAQLQVVASAQNGLARRTARASAVLRDFTEAASRWRWDDPRMQPNGGACAAYSAAMKLSEDDLGVDRTPAVTLQYTALPSSDATASDVGTTTDALTLGAMAYPGNTGALLAELVQARYQLAWTVWPLDANSNVADGCEARLVNVALRFPVGNSDRYRSIVSQLVQYNSASLFPPSVLPDGLPEQF
ncbi:MAG: prepilin-type N-terminal cleavage/methylation domain-containing protein [Myxococcaceae bacterium]|nr:prepilin-type N-terminal cleavage/methylation domain-containing protein [Myxococcaceae bacterium]MCI0673194.1 prepilin-type N-terminal cleavage/methylation domain-containing protein [Myxococcaceae bacterium]